MIDLMTEAGVQEYKCSNGWLKNFLKRYGLTTRRITGCGKSLPENVAEIINDYILEANESIKKNG